MIEFLNGFTQLISIVIDAVIAFFTNIIEFLTLLFKSSAFLLEVFMFFPFQYSAFLVAFVSFLVIRAILNNGE